MSRFQSTHSLRSATCSIIPDTSSAVVSIHALLAECDGKNLSGNPAVKPFQSTHSLRSATSAQPGAVRRQPVSIHALLAECDKAIYDYATFFHMFQSTHSLRSATLRKTVLQSCMIVSIHALLAECDTRTTKRNTKTIVSIHALLAECDHGLHRKVGVRSGFNPRTPCGVRLRPTLYIATQQSKSYFAPTSLKRPSLHGCSF